MGVLISCPIQAQTFKNLIVERCELWGLIGLDVVCAVTMSQAMEIAEKECRKVIGESHDYKGNEKFKSDVQVGSYLRHTVDKIISICMNSWCSNLGKINFKLVVS